MCHSHAVVNIYPSDGVMEIKKAAVSQHQMQLETRQFQAHIADSRLEAASK